MHTKYQKLTLLVLKKPLAFKNFYQNDAFVTLRPPGTQKPCIE